MRSPSPENLDLFVDSPADSALAELQNWFEAWLGHSRSLGQVRHDTSEEVYRDMWSVLMTWCLSQKPVVHLLAITASDLRVFLESRKGQAEDSALSSRYAWRHLSLVDRVLRFAAAELEQPVNTAATDLMAQLPAIRYANAGESGPPAFLPADEARQLVVFLSGIRPRGQSSAAPRDWRQLRDYAAVGLQLGGGLTPGDVRGLALDGVISVGGRLQGVPWKLVLAADGATPGRETPIAQWAGQLLKYWLNVRNERKIPGNWVFPATGTGKPWGRHAQYLSATDVLAAAGVDAVKGGSFRLRHTFALRQLRRGRSVEEVASWMGIVHVAEMARYTRVLYAPVDVV